MPKIEDAFINIGKGFFTADISYNIFTLSNLNTGKLVSGCNYHFNNNNLTILNSSMQFILKGTLIEAIGNTVSLDKGSKINVINDKEL